MKWKDAEQKYKIRKYKNENAIDKGETEVRSLARLGHLATQYT
jgi:hypothetical protein